MQKILSDYCFKNVTDDIDDILIMSETFDKHITSVKKVLNTLRNNGIKIKASKCEFFKPNVTFLGHVIGRDGIIKSPDFIKKIAEYSLPTNVTELQQFLGLVNFQQKNR